MDKSQIKKVALIIKIAIVVIVVIILGAGSFYTVNEQQQAVVTQFGKVAGVRSAGAHFKIPFIQQVTNVDMTTRGMEFGYRTNNGYMSSIENESFMITNDFNFVNVDFYVEWKVNDPEKFLFNSEDPVGLLRNILQAEARSVVSGYAVDDVLTTAKTEIQVKIRDGVSGKLSEYDLGLEVSNIALQDASPPTNEVTAAFKNVENAKQYKDTQINGANAYYNQKIPAARAEADKIVKEAEGLKEARINEARGEVAKFNEMFAEYVLNKDVTITRMYLEAMEEILPGVAVYVDGAEDVLKILNLEQAGGMNANEN